MTKLISRNAATKKMTAVDGPTAVEVEVYRGERDIRFAITTSSITITG